MSTSNKVTMQKIQRWKVLRPDVVGTTARKARGPRSIFTASSLLLMATIAMFLYYFVITSTFFISSSKSTISFSSSAGSSASATTSRRKDFISRAHQCNTSMTWDPYHHLDAFSQNMHAHYKEDWQVSTYFENLCGGTYL
jgi:hypothetical protein